MLVGLFKDGNLKPLWTSVWYHRSMYVNDIATLKSKSVHCGGILLNEEQSGLEASNGSERAMAHQSPKEFVS